MAAEKTIRHTRDFLTHIDKDAAILESARAFRRVLERRAPRASADLPGWCVTQISRIVQNAPLEVAITHPDVLTLMAVGYLALDRPAAIALHRDRTIPIPPRLKALESDFLPALLREAQDFASEYAPFSDRLGDARRRLTLIVPLLTRPGDARPPVRDATLARDAGGGWAVVDVLAVICAVCGLLKIGTKKKT